MNLGFHIPLFKPLFFLCSKGLNQFDFRKNSLCSEEEGKKVHLVISGFCSVTSCDMN